MHLFKVTWNCQGGTSNDFAKVTYQVLIYEVAKKIPQQHFASTCHVSFSKTKTNMSLLISPNRHSANVIQAEKLHLHLFHKSSTNLELQLLQHQIHS